MANPSIIYQSRKGIILTDGYYLVKNPKTNVVSVISISNGTAFIHDARTPINLQDLVNMDSTGYLEIYDELKPVEQLKNIKKNKKNNQE